MAAQRLGAARVLGALEWSSFAVVIFAFFVVGAGVGLGVAGLGPGPGSGSPGAARGHFYYQCFIHSVCIISSYPRSQGPSRA